MSNQVFLNQFISSLSDLEDNCRILQVGPGKDTYEIVSTTDLSRKKHVINDQYPRENKLNCEKCPFRIKSQKGKGIDGERLLYEACLFDKIILHAQTKLQRKNLFNEAERLLRADGQIITFIDIKKEGHNKVLSDFCFHSDWIIEQFGTHGFAIQSATVFRFMSSVAICLTASRTTFFGIEDW